MAGADQEPNGSTTATERSEGFGEHLLGTMIEQAHEMPPQLIAPLVAEVIAAIGGRDVALFLQDYEQLHLMPLPGKGLLVEEPARIEESLPGRAFLADALVEHPVDGGVRLFLPLRTGRTGGVLAFTSDDPDDDDRRLGRRFAGLVADVLVTKGMYTDRFF